MKFRLNLVFDRFVNGQPYPNLAPWQDLDQGYGHLGNEYPFVVPLRLLYYAEDHDFPIGIYSVNDVLPAKCFYPIGIGFFSFSVDYFSLIPPATLDLVRQGQIVVLFYYHEGDNPFQEKARLDELCQLYSLSTECYRFVSGNTAANDISGFMHFADHELFYWRANQYHPALVWNDQPRSHEFTLLSRTHKWWRASVVADLHRSGMLNRSFWSYNTISIDDNRDENPIQTDWFPGLDQSIDEFFAGAPYQCDHLDSDSHNRHHIVVNKHFRESYVHVVLETMFDADQSGGTFLTEKTFKPIKHAQPFVLVAPPKSLETLRSLGYHTFDDHIINHYDQVIDNTQRWINVRASISALLTQDLHRWAERCKYIAIYNQQLFVSSKFDRLNKLSQQLNDSIN